MDKSLYFYDPNHGNCLRIVNKVDKNVYIINGAYGNDEGKSGYWAAMAEKKKIFKYKGQKYNLEVNFFMKKKITHKQVYYAYMANRKIKWQDGNTWLQLYA
jgi:hypothetical protein